MTMSTPAFSPEETQTILHHLQQPAVFLNMTCGWPVLQWTAEHLSECFGDRLIRFRLGRKDETNKPLFETHCSYVEAKMPQFLSWSRTEPRADVGPFSEYSITEYWAYADYKYIAVLFQDQPSMFEDIMWSQFGFQGRNGKESTLWIGTEGANTPCHVDSYGFNLVLQVQGRKRWHLFPPEDTANLYPTRIPYEESSVFSQVDVLQPDLRRFPAFKRTRSHTVTLHPGQVLYVPRHWWHYVESVDNVTVSVNTWIELGADDESRVGEAVTKAVVCALKSMPSSDNTDNWLNPTEEGVASHRENMQYVTLAVRACSQKLKCQDQRQTRPVKRDSSGQIQKSRDLIKDAVPFNIPFGPHLIPVHCEQKDSSESTCMSPKDWEAISSTKCELKYHQDGPQQAEHECRPGSAQSRTCDSGEGRSTHIPPEMEESRLTITTNDLLDCLVHPDIITRVTELLLERHSGGPSTLNALWH